MPSKMTFIQYPPRPIPRKTKEGTDFLMWDCCCRDERPRKQGEFSQNTSIALEKRRDVHQSTKNTGGNMMPSV